MILDNKLFAYVTLCKLFIEIKKISKVFSFGDFIIIKGGAKKVLVENWPIPGLSTTLS